MTLKLILSFVFFILNFVTTFAQKPAEKLLTFKNKAIINQFNVNHSHYFQLSASGPRRFEIWHWNDSSEKLSFLADIKIPTKGNRGIFVNGNNALYFVSNNVDSQTVLLRLEDDSITKSFKYPYYSYSDQRNGLAFRFHLKKDLKGRAFLAGGYFDEKLDTMIMLDTPNTIAHQIRICDGFVLYSKFDNSGSGSTKTYIRSFGSQKDSFLFKGVISAHTCFKQDGIWYWNITRDGRENIWRIGKDWKPDENITKLAPCSQSLVTDYTKYGTFIARNHAAGGPYCSDSALAMYIVRQEKVETLNYNYSPYAFTLRTHVIAIDSNHIFFNAGGTGTTLAHVQKRQKFIRLNGKIKGWDGLASNNNGKFFYIEYHYNGGNPWETITGYNISNDSNGRLVPKHERINELYIKEKYLYYVADTFIKTDSVKSSLYRVLLNRPLVVFSKSPTNVLKTSLNVFPNPASDKVHFSYPISGGSVYNLQGKRVLQFAEGKTELDVSHLKAGMYLVRTRDGHSARMVIQR